MRYAYISVIGLFLLMSCSSTPSELIDNYCDCISACEADSTALTSCDDIARDNISNLEKMRRKGFITDTEKENAENNMWRCYDNKVKSVERMKHVHP